MNLKQARRLTARSFDPSESFAEAFERCSLLPSSVVAKHVRAFRIEAAVCVVTLGSFRGAAFADVRQECGTCEIGWWPRTAPLSRGSGVHGDIEPAAVADQHAVDARRVVSGDGARGELGRWRFRAIVGRQLLARKGRLERCVQHPRGARSRTSAVIRTTARCRGAIAVGAGEAGSVAGGTIAGFRLRAYGTRRWNWAWAFHRAAPMAAARGRGRRCPRLAPDCGERTSACSIARAAAAVLAARRGTSRSSAGVAALAGAAQLFRPTGAASAREKKQQRAAEHASPT